MTISFIIPVYNGERYISACLYSLLLQSYYKKVKCGKI